MNDIRYGLMQYGFSATTGDVSLAAGATIALTIQQPAAPNPRRTVRLRAAEVQCKANSFDVTRFQNGTDATATAVPVSTTNPTVAGYTALNPQQPGRTTPLALLFSASNVGTGQPVGGVLSVAAGGNPLVLDLTEMYLPQNSPNINFTIVLKNTDASVTDTGRITLYWDEE